MPKLLYFEEDVLWAVSCRDTRWYLRNKERRIPDASCNSLKKLFYEPCPAGTHADVYETENEGFLMPKLLYSILKEMLYELCPAGTHANIYETEDGGLLMPVAIIWRSCFMSRVLQGRTLISTKQRTKGSFLMPVFLFVRSYFMSCVLQGRTLISTKQKTEGGACWMLADTSSTRRPILLILLL